MADFSWVPEGYKGIFSYVDKKLVASCSKCGATRQTSGKGAVLRDIEAGKGQKFLMCGSCRHYKGAKPTKKEIDSWPEGHKRCTDCREVKPFSDFHKHAGAMFGYNTVCKACRIPISKKKWQDTDYRYKMYSRAKSRAKRLNRKFDIKLEDIIIPDMCPILGVPLDHTPGSPHVPSLDRIDCDRGYTPDNIMVMSRRANTLKNDMTLHEAEAIFRFLNKLNSSTIKK